MIQARLDWLAKYDLGEEDILRDDNGKEYIIAKVDGHDDWTHNGDEEIYLPDNLQFRSLSEGDIEQLESEAPKD